MWPEAPDAACVLDYSARRRQALSRGEPGATRPRPGRHRIRPRPRRPHGPGDRGGRPGARAPARRGRDPGLRLRHEQPRAARSASCGRRASTASSWPGATRCSTRAPTKSCCRCASSGAWGRRRRCVQQRHPCAADDRGDLRLRAGPRSARRPGRPAGGACASGTASRSRPRRCSSRSGTLRSAASSPGPLGRGARRRRCGVRPRAPRGPVARARRRGAAARGRTAAEPAPPERRASRRYPASGSSSLRSR